VTAAMAPSRRLTNLAAPAPFRAATPATTASQTTGCQPRQRTVLTGDGARLACTDYGDPTAAHTVLFLHGLCLNSTSWTQHIGWLTRRYGPALRIITYDHRGHGDSGAAPTRSYTIACLAADLSDVLRTLHVHGPLTLVGHSMGGMAALAYLDRPARQRPVDPTGLVLIATAAGKLNHHGLGRLLGTPGAVTLLKRAAKAPEHLLRTLARPLCALLSHLGEHLEANTLASLTWNALTTTPPRTALGFLTALGTYNVYEALPLISARTVIVSGGLDPLTPAAHSRDLAAAIPGAQHVAIAEAGHMLPQQAPELILRAITTTVTAQSHPAASCPPEPLLPSSIPSPSALRCDLMLTPIQRGHPHQWQPTLTPAQPTPPTTLQAAIRTTPGGARP
jgi:pimeloyl-ACP methyl ester carboxylesterase